MDRITTESLILIHNRVREACLAKYNIDFDRFMIWDDGSVACYYTPSYSYADEEEYYLTVEDLQDENLDKLAEERKAKQKLENEKMVEEQRLATERREIREKEERKQQFIKLKKEFENG